MSESSESQDKRMWWWRPFFSRHESAETRQARQTLFDALPREAVSDEYGSRPKWHQHIEAIYQRMPADSKRLHPNEPRWQQLLAHKYIHDKAALARFLAVVRETDADDAYLYFPLGAEKPNVWYHDSRYTAEEFSEKFGEGVSS